MVNCARAARVSPKVAVGLLVLQGCLVMWIDCRNSPNPDEMAHLPAGIFNWQYGQYDVYIVNPPLPRMMAALPVLWRRPKFDWSHYDENPQHRREIAMGIAFCEANGRETYSYFTLARWFCIPLCLVGGYYCYRWAGELYGPGAAILAQLLWCFSPNVLAWSATICPDAAAASLGLAACYFFWRWLQGPDWLGALRAGLALGLAELTKMTWVILFVVWPITWLAWRWREPRKTAARAVAVVGGLQLAVVLTAGLFVLNLGYAFSGTFTKLGDFRFVSRSLAGHGSPSPSENGGNRFSPGWFANIPVPLPKDYVLGIDLQKRDFEQGLRSYVLGQWHHRGWWYYYLVCLAVKVPLGTWIVGMLAVAVTTTGRGAKTGGSKCGANWNSGLAVLLPGIAVVALVASQTGIGRHFRYMLPAAPFFFVWASRAACAIRGRSIMGTAVLGAMVWSVASSLWIYPHSMSYFNEIAGGPIGGSRFLLDANIDWQQDTLYLEAWCEKHHDATPVRMIWRGGCDYWPKPASAADAFERSGGSIAAPLIETLADDVRRLTPGWYAASMHRLYESDDMICRDLLRLRPAARAGYSILIYHVLPGDLHGLEADNVP